MLIFCRERITDLSLRLAQFPSERYGMSLVTGSIIPEITGFMFLITLIFLYIYKMVQKVQIKSN